MGEKAPLEDRSITHSICPAHLRAMLEGRRHTMDARYIVTLLLDNYESTREHSVDGFPDYESALVYAKKHAVCINNGRAVAYSATIYKIVEVVQVYQHPKTLDFVIEKEK